MSSDASSQDSGDIGRRLAESRRVIEGTCRACGRPFRGAKNRRYCNDRCRWHHYRHREREEAYVLQYRLAAVRLGSADLFLDQDGRYWLQLDCLQGPKPGEPGYPADPAPKVFAASYRGLFLAFARENRSPQED